MNASSYAEAVLWYRIVPMLVMFAVFGLAFWLDARDDKKKAAAEAAKWKW
jgi:hypothetical protein